MPPEFAFACSCDCASSVLSVTKVLSRDWLCENALFKTKQKKTKKPQMNKKNQPKPSGDDKRCDLLTPTEMLRTLSKEQTPPGPVSDSRLHGSAQRGCWWRGSPGQ